MIAFLRGELVSILKDYIIIDVNGVGYKVYVPASTLGRLPQCGTAILINTSFIVREDSQHLYGFLTNKEQDIFELLITISGIGPKGALAILSGVTIEDLSQAIVQENVTLLTKVPGVGKKTAQRIIIELKDKLAKEALDSNCIDEPTLMAGNIHNGLNDAIDALTGLGYSYSEAKNIVVKVNKTMPDAQIEEVIKVALKELAKF
jgi:holliday junction DNA helicase RuvA